mgnify:CR=1 FL=1
MEDITVSNVNEDDVAHSDRRFFDEGDRILASLNKRTHTNPSRSEKNLFAVTKQKGYLF